jgi:SagB-type dehydrogenase family enzyme
VPKLAWVLLPIILYAGFLACVLLLRRKLPSRQELNVHLSLLLMLYLAATAGLGIFWVANQQLPVFDWHYLFGYGTVALLVVHLYFNLPMALRALRGTQRRAALPGEGKGRNAVMVAAMLGALAGAYFLGASRQGTTHSPVMQEAQGVAAVVRFHEFSSESRRDIFARAPGIAWGDAPPDFKFYPTVPHIALQRGSVGRRGLSASLRSAGARAHGLQWSELGDLLYLSAGVTERRGGTALRASPSSGALFSGELYVLARSVQGLAPGIYHYDPDHDRLDVLGPLPATSGAPTAGDAEATVVLTSVVRRTAYKYGDRAYRYVVADGGHLLENLRVAGQSAGLQATLAPRFDEARLAQSLGVDGVEESVLAVMELRGKQGAAGNLSAPRFVVAPPRAESATGVTGMVHQATSLRVASAEAGVTITLPVPQASDAEVARVIRERRSKRRYSADPVPLGVLASILADMAQADQLASAIRINLVVNRVQGLAPGIYRYDRRHVLTPVRRGDFAAAAESAALSQAVIGDAAVVLVLSAERGPLLAEGARGYRHGFIEAGLIGERWLLGAVARGLGACPVGAFYDDEAAALINVDMRSEWVLHFAALGVPAGD